MKIHIYVGPTWEAFNPDSLVTGTGGSEVAVINMQIQLAMAGHDVTVWGSAYDYGEPTAFAGHWRSHTEWSTQEPCDLLIFWRQVPQVKGLWRLAAKRVWVWLHDINPIRLPSAILDRIERVIVLSDFHKTTLDPTIVDKAVVIPNGINPHLYRNDGTVRYTHHYFYSSSPRRGLAKLLDQWPAVMAKDPFSQLHVAYGFGLPIRIAEKNEPHLVPMLQDLLVRVQTMDGVFYSDRIGQSALARLQMSCEAWLYPPNDFQEVHCITALEAQAAECVPVTRLGGALNMTVNNCLEWKEGMELVDLVEKIDCFSPQLLAENRAKALSTSWDAVAKQWQLLF